MPPGALGAPVGDVRPKNQLVLSRIAAVQLVDASRHEFACAARRRTACIPPRTACTHPCPSPPPCLRTTAQPPSRRHTHAFHCPSQRPLAPTPWTHRRQGPVQCGRGQARRHAHVPLPRCRPLNGQPVARGAAQSPARGALRRSSGGRLGGGRLGGGWVGLGGVVSFVL
eukprot:4488078-Prymnesium_polylepis.1